MTHELLEIFDPIVFLRPSRADLRRLWNPIIPPFHPIIDLEKISMITCPYLSYYKNIIGLNSFGRNVSLVRPNTEENYRGYGRDLREFQRVIIETLKRLVWDDRIINLVNQDPEDSDGWHRFIRSILNVEQQYLESHLIGLLSRLHNDNILQEYPNYRGRIIFNLQVFNPEIFIDTNRHDRVFELPTRRTVQNQVQRNFQWRGSFPGYSLLQELNLERHELVIYYYYNREFIPTEEISQTNFANRELHFFINPLLLFLWSSRLALGSLGNQFLSDFRLQYILSDIYTPIQNILPNSSEILNYNLRVETIDSTYTQDDIFFNTEETLAQNFIVHQLTQRNDAWRTFQLERYCPIGGRKDRFCNISWACRMREFVTLPKPLVTRNVRKFQRSLRDEITLAYKNFYYLYRFIFDEPDEYRRHLSFWLGDVSALGDAYIYTDLINPLYDRAPRERDLTCIFLTPFVFPKDYILRLIDNGEITEIEVLNESQSILHIKELISPRSPMRIMVGYFPEIKDTTLLKRQQDNLWRACNFQSNWEMEQEFHGDLETIEMEYLRRRLSQNQRRAGEVIFGNRVRFI